MKNKQKMKWIGFFLFVFMSGITDCLMAQEDIRVEEVQVIKDFEARLKDFQKVNLDPVLPVFDIDSRKYEYKVSAIPIKLKYEKPSIRPLALPDEPSVKRYNGMFSLAYGVPNALNGAFSYGTTKEDFSSSVAIRHRSANNKKIVNQQFIQNSVDFVLSDSPAADFSYEGHAFFDVDYRYMYGVEAASDTTINYGSPERRLLRGDLAATLFKEELTGIMDANLTLGYRFLHENKESLIEHGLYVQTGLDFDFDESIRLNIPLTLDVIATKAPGSSALFGATPVFSYSNRFFQLKFGADLAWSDTLVAWPEAEISIKKLMRYFDVFIGTGQEARLHTAYDKTRLNPFYHLSTDSVALGWEQGYFAGIRGDVEGAKFEIRAGYEQLNNMALFIPSATDPRKFSIVYDDGSDYSVKGMLSYEISSHITLSGVAAKHFYAMERQEKAWHRPDFEADVTGRFNFFSNRFLVDGKLYFASGLHSPTLQGGDYETLPVIFDLSGAVQYRLSPAFSLSFEWNNVLAREYTRWYQYPAYKVFLLGGIKWQF